MAANTVSTIEASSNEQVTAPRGNTDPVIPWSFGRMEFDAVDVCTNHIFVFMDNAGR
jgi:hypothetical protein